MIFKVKKDRENRLNEIARTSALNSGVPEVMDFVLPVLYIIQETCYLLSVTIDPSLIRMSLKKLCGTACDISAMVTEG